MNRLLITGTGSGCGKTTVTMGLLAALKARGLAVSSFKCGPDYIDPMFHREALGIPSYNLDPFFSDGEDLKRSFLRHAGRDISVMEGVMGYYDGIGTEGTCSTWDVARITGTPAVLVISAGGMATIREDTTPQPKELKTVEIPTAERLNYPKETFGRDENRNRRPRERDERRGGGERCGCRNRREGFDKDDAHREKSCGCHEGKEGISCMCRSLLSKTKRFFGKLFGKTPKQSEEHSCGCRQHGEQKHFDRGANRPGGYRRPRRRPGNRPPQNRGE